jgi:hypothetical protein
MDPISAHVAEQSLGNVRPPLMLDVMAPEWLPGDSTFDLIYCANMLHISPWATCAALMQGSAHHMTPGGVLVTYGPYLEDGVPTSEGNVTFDQSLRTQDPAWGIRRKEDVEQEAAGLACGCGRDMQCLPTICCWSGNGHPAIEGEHFGVSLRCVDAPSLQYVRYYFYSFSRFPSRATASFLINFRFSPGQRGDQRLFSTGLAVNQLAGYARMNSLAFSVRALSQAS